MTVAVSVTLGAAAALAVATIEIVSVAPTGTVPIDAVTVDPVKVGVRPGMLDEAETNVSPEGSTSLTTTPVASSGPLVLSKTLIVPSGASTGVAYQYLYWGSFIFAIANGTLEGVANPLVATLFPHNRTHYLNILHDLQFTRMRFTEGLAGMSALYALLLLVVTGIVGRLLDAWQARVIAKELTMQNRILAVAIIAGENGFVANVIGDVGEIDAAARSAGLPEKRLDIWMLHEAVTSGRTPEIRRDLDD